jgi:membrane associated rhomboid family serine protease
VSRENRRGTEAAPKLKQIYSPFFLFQIDKKNGLGYSHDMRLSGRKPSAFTRRWTQQQRVALLALITANIIVFAIQVILQSYDSAFVRDYLALSQSGMRAAYGWQFFTAMFLHDGPWDLLGNMLLLYLLGRDVESILGQRQFLILYFSGVIAGELGHLFLMPSNCALHAAGGGVAAVLVAYATILPEMELTSLVFFVLPIRLKAKHLAYGVFFIALALVVFDRVGTVTHSAYFGGCIAGWFYSHLLGFGRPSYIQRIMRRRRAEADRLERMGAEEFIAEQIDPLLDKISRSGINSLTRSEKRKLALAREKFGQQSGSAR